MTNEQKRLNEFARLVKDMRQAQKQYFRERGGDNLEASKKLEKMVDRKIESILEPRLFDD